MLRALAMPHCGATLGAVLPWPRRRWPRLRRNAVTRIPIDPDTIRALAAVLVETGLTEIEIADKDSRIRVVRGGGVATTVLPVAAPVASLAAAVAPATHEQPTHPGAVLSPM